MIKNIPFLQGNKRKVRELEKLFRTKAKTARLEYKTMSARDAWKSLNVMMGRNTQQQRMKSSDPVKL